MISRVFATFLICFLPLIAFAKTPWNKLESGIAYRAVSVKDYSGVLHVFRIDPKKFQFRFSARHHSFPSGKQLVRKYHAFIAFNGGFFSPNLKPLGLRVQQGKVISRMAPTSWWHVFFIRNHRAYIVSKNRYRQMKSVQFAIQSGPRLLVHGDVPKLRDGKDERTVLGIDYQGYVVLAVTEGLALTTTELGYAMKDLGCKYALNLDGGTSTHLYAHFSSLSLNIVGLKPLVDPILVVPANV